MRAPSPGSPLISTLLVAVGAVMAAPSIDPAQFRWVDPAAERCFVALTDAAPALVPDGHTVPWRALGNSLRQSRCSDGISPRSCASGTAGRNPPAGASWAELSALHYPDRWPDVFGTTWSAGRVAPHGGLSRAWLSVNGAGVSGEQLMLEWVPAGWAAPQPALTLGLRLEHVVAETTFAIHPSPPSTGSAALAELMALSASVDGFTALARTRVSALATEVHRGLGAGEATQCVYGAYEGDGVPPECTPRPLTPAELTEERARIDALTAARLAFIDAHAPQLYADVLALLPCAT